MSDLELLFLVLVLVYAWECACWLRRGSVAFRTWLGRRWRIVHPGALLGNQRGGVIFACPLPPLGTVLTGNQFPLSLSAEAVLAYTAPSINPGWRPPQTGKLLRADEIRTIEAVRNKVRINGEVLVKTASPTFAANVAQRLRSWSQAAPAEREKLLRKLFGDSLDVKAIEHRWQEFQEETRSLHFLASFLFGYLFVFAPVLIRFFGLGRTWLALLLGLLACTTGAALLFHRAHKHFYPNAEEERFTHFLLILLAPATTIRTADVLSRPLLEEFHPLAIAKVLCPEATFREFARRILVELYHPGLPVCPRDEPAAQAAERHSRTLLQTAVEEFLRRNGVNPEELVKPPARTEEGCLSYCPRCQAQFTTAEGVCADCGGLPLVRFSP
jgi:hypothetical protein